MTALTGIAGLTPVAAVTIAASVAVFVAFVWAVYQLLDAGTDSHAAGPWQRPEPTRRPTRLPADFVGLWSLFGRRSMRDYSGSWEAAVSRLDRLESSLLANQPAAQGKDSGTLLPPLPPPAGSTRGSSALAEDWLKRRLDQLEALAGISTTSPPDDNLSADNVPAGNHPTGSFPAVRDPLRAPRT